MIRYLAALLVFSLLLSCSDAEVAGTVTEVNSGSIAGTLAHEQAIHDEMVEVALVAKSGAVLSKLPDSINALRSLVVEDGAFLFDSLPAGEYSIEVYQDGIRVNEETEITLDEGQNINITINVTIVIQQTFIIHQITENVTINNFYVNNGNAQVAVDGDSLSLQFAERDTIDVEVEAIRDGETILVSGRLLADGNGGYILQLDEELEIDVEPAGVLLSSSSIRSSSSASLSSSSFAAWSSMSAPSSDLSVMIDERDGSEYNVVQIGSQIWMAENLKYLPQVDNSGAGSESEVGLYYYVQGLPIPEGETEAEQIANAKAMDTYQAYGVLYNWYAAMNSTAPEGFEDIEYQGVCPSGWHIPSSLEWEQLASYISENTGDGYQSVDGWENIAQHLKATSVWGTSEAYDSFGFSALPGGFRNEQTTMLSNMEVYGYWWSKTLNTSEPVFYDLGRTYDSFLERTFSPDGAFSVRCIKN
jgi:uncharacterized protein (TIGR02145 family)